MRTEGQKQTERQDEANSPFSQFVNASKKVIR